MEFLELFYDSTVVLSGVYYPTNPLVLHYILEIASHLHAAERYHNFRNIVAPMKLKFLKYWEDIPLLYSYAFILDPRAKMKGFLMRCNYLLIVLEPLTVHTMPMSNLNCINCLENMRLSLVQLDLKGFHSHQLIQVRKSNHGQRSLENMLVQVVLVLLLSLPPHLHLVMIVRSQLT